MRIPPVTLALLFALGVAFILQYLARDAVIPLMLWPLGEHPLGVGADGQVVVAAFRPWQLVTYAFLHGNFAHLFFNAFALYQFGTPVEHAWGSRRYAIYLLTCVVGAGLMQLAVSYLVPGDVHPVVGASGGIFALLLAYAVLFPNNRLMLLFPPIPMRARTAVIVFGVLELVLGFSGAQPGVAHFVHLGGLLFGWLLIRYWRGKPPRGRTGTFA
jgi:membrane associated rhomboid family serine protease